MNTEQERAEFEDWLGIIPCGSAHDLAWEAWQARAAIAADRQERQSEAEEVCCEAYLVVGSLLSDLGIFETHHAEKILDNLSQAKMVHDDVLPWPSFDRKQKGEVVVTRDESGFIIAVTRQDDEGRILSVIAEAAQPTVSVRSADELIAVIRDWLEQDNPAHYGDFEKRLVAIIDGEPDPADEELRRDAELGRAAMRFADRAGDVHPGIDDADRICAEFYAAMSEVLDRQHDAISADKKEES